MPTSATSSGGSNGTGTASSLVTTLVPILLVSGIMLAAFLVLRRTLSRNYEPRAFMLRQQERTPRLSKSLFGWYKEMMAIPDTWVLNHHSMDGYLLLRFLKISTVICLVGCCITWPVLFPVNATGGGGQVELNVVGFQNIKQQVNNPRLYAHTFVGWIFFSFVWFMISRETIFYINLRQAYLLSPLYAHRLSSKTVIYSSVPKEILDGAIIKRMFGQKLKNYWICTDCGDLQKLVDERDKAAFQLEGAENKLVKMAVANRLKAQKKKGGAAAEDDAGVSTSVDGESGSIASKWVPAKNRPTHRTKFLIGKKVDTINWCRQELERLIPEVEQMQKQHKNGEAKYVNSIIVEFHNQADAQAAYQTTTHHQPLHMAPRYIGVNPESVVWSNFRILWWERVLRYAATTAAVCVTIIFWAIPVAFVGLLSNIDGLIHGVDGKPPLAPWLGFLDKIPTVIFGVVKGLLPSVLLAVLMSLLPVFLRLMAKLGGCMSRAEVELRTQNYYFAFQIVQVFLVTTLGSTATSVIQGIAANPSSTPGLLAQKIPSVSTFYISYFLVQGLSFAAGNLLQIVGVVLFFVLSKILDTTPRKMYKRWINLSSLSWGTVFPVYSLLVAISIIYSCFSPLMMGFGAIGLYLFYLANRYNLLFVYNSPIDTKGLCYPLALQHVTVGLYIGIVLMIGLFAASESVGPTILMVVYLIFSILFHMSFSTAVTPLLDTLPRSLEVEEEHLLLMEENGQESSTNGASYSKEGATSADAARTHGADGADRRINGGQGTTADEETGATKGPLSIPPPHKKPSMFAKFINPGKYADYQTLRRMVPHDFADVRYSDTIESHAFFNPCITSEPPMLWIARDSMGISRQEVAHTNKVIPISDEGAWFDENGKIGWNKEHETDLPVYEEKMYY